MKTVPPTGLSILPKVSEASLSRRLPAALRLALEALRLERCRNCKKLCSKLCTRSVELVNLYLNICSLPWVSPIKSIGKADYCLNVPELPATLENFYY